MAADGGLIQIKSPSSSGWLDKRSHWMQFMCKEYPKMFITTSQTNVDETTRMDLHNEPHFKRRLELNDVT
jgi:hypothetical protein